MPVIPISELIPILQIAVGPVILVSGIGLLLLTMTNRLGRVVDRARLLGHELKNAPAGEQEALRAQLRILSGRAELIQLAITLASVSVLLAAVLVIVLFSTALFRLEVAWLIGLLFIGCMLSLIASIAAFILDVNRSLVAMRLELESEGGGEPLARDKSRPGS